MAWSYAELFRAFLSLGSPECCKVVLGFSGVRQGQEHSKLAHGFLQCGTRWPGALRSGAELSWCWGSPSTVKQQLLAGGVVVVGLECSKVAHGFLWGRARQPRAMRLGAGFSLGWHLAQSMASSIPIRRGAALEMLHPLQFGGASSCKLGHKEFSMAVACPFSSPLPNNGTLSLLWVQTFSWVPSAMAFHSPALSVPPTPSSAHHSLDS